MAYTEFCKNQMLKSLEMTNTLTYMSSSIILENGWYDFEV